MLQKLFHCADRYLEESDWKDLAVLKFCLCAAGVMIGLAVPEKKRKIPFFLAGIVFLAAYIPLMVKFIRILREEWRTA